MKWPIYNSDTGIFTWPSGQQAGTIEKKGYRQITIARKRYKAHRIAWFLMTGKWPKHQIDHINCDKDDNRWCNLREATNSENKRNGKARADSKSGYKGIVRHYGKWRVRLQLHTLGRQQHCGYFVNLLDAIVCANFHIAWTHGEFARLNQMPLEWSHD